MKVHFIAIGGSGMGAMAVLMAQSGHEVRGSDVGVYPPMSTQLAQAGIDVMEGFGGHNLEWGPDCVVVGNVCSSDHVEVVAARERGIELQSFPGLLERTLLTEKRSLVVAGTHGKTTTTSLLAWCLERCGAQPSWLVGGVPQNLGVGSRLGTGPSIVLEGDEYDTAFFDKKSKFLHYTPQRAILTGVEFDHADIFTDRNHVVSAFREFVATIPASGSLVVHHDDAEAMGIAAGADCEVVPFRVLPDTDGEADPGGYCARVLSKPSARRIEFEVYERGQSLGTWSTSLVGRYNVRNILAAIAVARMEGCETGPLRDAVARFRGVKRRQELVGVAQGVRVIDDFAHHPTAVQLTVTAIRRRFPENSLHVCFEPRSASSRRNVFFEAYSRAFAGASEAYLGPLHAPEKIPEAQRLTPRDLARAISERGVTAHAFDSVDELCSRVLARAVPGDTVLVLSSGAFGGLVDRILQGFGDAVVRATAEDLPEVDKLLESYSMAAIRDSLSVETLVIRDEKGIVGCVSLEVRGDRAHFFGLAVRRGRRREGLGWALADRVLRRARTLGARQVYLLTGDSADFFASKLGFARVDVDDLDPEFRNLASFESALAKDSICMVCQLDPAP